MKKTFLLTTIILVQIGLNNLVSAQEAPKQLPDAELRQKLMGTWSLDKVSATGRVRTFGSIVLAANGAYAEQMRVGPVNDPSGNKTDTFTSSGTWLVKEGSLLKTVRSYKEVTGGSDPAAAKPAGPPKPFKPYTNSAKISLTTDDVMELITKIPTGQDKFTERTEIYKRKQ